MTFPEVNSLFEAQYIHNQNSWEQTRIISYSAASSFGGLKGITPQKFLPLDWDKNTQKNQPTRPALSSDQFNELCLNLKL